MLSIASNSGNSFLMPRTPPILETALPLDDFGVATDASRASSRFLSSTYFSFSHSFFSLRKNINFIFNMFVRPSGSTGAAVRPHTSPARVQLPSRPPHRYHSPSRYQNSERDTARHSPSTFQTSGSSALNRWVNSTFDSSRQSSLAKDTPQFRHRKIIALR